MMDNPIVSFYLLSLHLLFYYSFYVALYRQAIVGNSSF